MAEASDPGGDDATVQGELWTKVARSRVSSHSTWALPIYEAMVDELAVEPGAIVLDVGCGSGEGCQVLATHGMVAWGLDPARTMIEIAKERLPRGEFRVASMDAIPWGDACVDGATSVNSFHFTDAPPRAARELFRILRPGRRVAINCFGPREGAALLEHAFTALLALVPEPRKRESPFIDPFRLASVGVIEMFLRDAGFVEVADAYVDAPIRFGSVAEGTNGVLNTALARAVTELAGEEAARHAIANIIAQGEAPDGGVLLPCRARIIYGTRPA